MNIKLTDLKVKSLVSKEKKYKVFDSQVSGMFVLVRPTGKKVFQIRVREFQKIKDITIGEHGVFTLKAARAKANQIKLDHAEGEIVSRKYASRKQIDEPRTLEEVCLNWLENYKLDYPKKYTETKNRMVKHLFPYFTNKSTKQKRLIQELKRQDIKDFINHMKKKGIAHTAIRIKQNLVHVWEDARDRELVTENIINGIKFKKPGVEQHQVAEINPQKFARILNRIDKYKYSSLEQEVGIKLMAHVFARHSELAAMKWSDIDFTNRKWEYMQTKTGDIRLVPLSKQVINLLNTLPKTSEYVFSSEGTKSGHISTFRTEFLKIINPNEHTIHGFRASARTILQEHLRFSPDVIEHQLGHVVPDRLSKSYNRTKHLPDRTKMMTAWSNYLDKIKREVTAIKLVSTDD